MSIRSVRGVLVPLVVAVTVAAGGCSLRTSGYQFVRSPSTGIYLKVPEKWKVFDGDEVNRYLEKELAADPAARSIVPFIATFDAARPPEISFDGGGDAPAGMVRVRTISPSERDSVSMASLREEILAFQSGVESGQITVVSLEERQQDDGVRGQRVVFRLAGDDGPARTIDQTTLVNKSTNKLYLLAVGCNASCYESNRDQIDTVVTSLTIKER